MHQHVVNEHCEEEHYRTDHVDTRPPVKVMD